MTEQSSAAAASLTSGGFVELLGLRFDEVTPDRVVLSWDVTPALHQPYGIVHGGVYASAVETAASIAAAAWLGERGQVVGVSNSTDFLRAVRDGSLRAVAEPVHRGAPAAAVAGGDPGRERAARGPRPGPVAEHPRRRPPRRAGTVDGALSSVAGLDDREHVHAETRAQWRTWLVENHGRSTRRLARQLEAVRPGGPASAMRSRSRRRSASAGSTARAAGSTTSGASCGSRRGIRARPGRARTRSAWRGSRRPACCSRRGVVPSRSPRRTAPGRCSTTSRTSSSRLISRPLWRRTPAPGSTGTRSPLGAARDPRVDRPGPYRADAREADRRDRGEGVRRRARQRMAPEDLKRSAADVRRRASRACSSPRR